MNRPTQIDHFKRPMSSSFHAHNFKGELRSLTSKQKRQKDKRTWQAEWEDELEDMRLEHLAWEDWWATELGHLAEIYYD